MVMFSRGSLTTGASSRSRSSIDRAFLTDSRENGSVSNSGMDLGMDLPRRGNAAVDMQDFAVDERGGRAQQECAGCCIVLFAAEPAQRDGARTALVFGLVVEPECAGSRHRARCDGI